MTVDTAKVGSLRHTYYIAGVDCRIPNNWKYELTLTAANDVSSQPAMTTDGYSVIDGAYVTAKCQVKIYIFGIFSIEVQMVK